MDRSARSCRSAGTSSERPRPPTGSAGTPRLQAGPATAAPHRASPRRRPGPCRGKSAAGNAEGPRTRPTRIRFPRWPPRPPGPRPLRRLRSASATGPRPARAIRPGRRSAASPPRPGPYSSRQRAAASAESPARPAPGRRSTASPVRSRRRARPKAATAATRARGPAVRPTAGAPRSSPTQQAIAHPVGDQRERQEREEGRRRIDVGPQPVGAQRPSLQSGDVGEIVEPAGGVQRHLRAGPEAGEVGPAACCFSNSSSGRLASAKAAISAQSSTGRGATEASGAVVSVGMPARLAASACRAAGNAGRPGALLRRRRTGRAAGPT